VKVVGHHPNSSPLLPKALVSHMTHETSDSMKSALSDYIGKKLPCKLLLTGDEEDSVMEFYK